MVFVNKRPRRDSVSSHFRSARRRPFPPARAHCRATIARGIGMRNFGRAIEARIRGEDSRRGESWGSAVPANNRACRDRIASIKSVSLAFRAIILTPLPLPLSLQYTRSIDRSRRIRFAKLLFPVSDSPQGRRDKRHGPITDRCLSIDACATRSTRILVINGGFVAFRSVKTLVRIRLKFRVFSSYALLLHTCKNVASKNRVKTYRRGVILVILVVITRLTGSNVLRPSDSNVWLNW